MPALSGLLGSSSPCTTAVITWYGPAAPAGVAPPNAGTLEMIWKLLIKPASFTTGRGECLSSCPQPPVNAIAIPTPTDTAMNCPFMARPPNTVKDKGARMEWWDHHRREAADRSRRPVNIL